MLDMRTIVFSNVVTDIVCLVVIVLLWQQSRKRFAGTGLLVFDFALQTTALFLIVLRGSIPDWISMVLANALAMTGALLGYMGLTRFVEKKSSQIHNYVLLAAFVLVHAHFALVQPNLAARNLNLSAVLLIICFQCAWLLLGRVEPSRRQLTRGVGTVFAAFCVINVIRIVDFFTGAHSTSDYLHAGTFEQFVMVSNQMLFILLTYSLALMFNKRLLLEITTQEEKFSKAFHSSNHAITITRMSDGQIIEVNDSFFRITGYQLADVKGSTTIGMHLWDREEDRTLVVSELTSKGNVHDREFQFRKKSGETITGLFSADVITVKNEICVLSSINDITRIKRAEELLRESEERYRGLIINLDSGIVVHAPDTLIRMNNTRASELLGVSDDQMKGRQAIDPNWKFISETNIPLQLEEYPVNQIVASKKPIKNQTFGVCRPLTNDIVWLMVNGFPVLDSKGELSEIIVSLIDITERKQAEEALRESENKYKSLMENIPDIIFTIDLAGKITFVSQRTKEILGYESSETVNMSIFDFIPKEDHQKTMENLQKGMKGEKIKHFQIPMIAKSGERLFFECSFSRIYKDGELVGAQGTAADITGRKRVEEDIIRLNAELEQRVSEQTEELRKGQLALLNLVEDMNQSVKIIDIANRALDATNKELESFSYSVSHDLRAPLRSIDGFSQALLEDCQEKLDDTERNYLKKIRAATQNMGMLIDDMLKLSKVIQAEFMDESIDVSKMVKDILRTVSQNNPARKVKLSIQKGIIINGDRHMLEIALTNLIENAWKFTGKTENARIEFGTLLKDGKPVMFIRDNGIGFDMSYVNKLFGAFQRLHAKDEFAGTGIGLATVKRIITRHGGDVWAEGEVGKGATFFFTIP